ncbi:hypothetical protein [Planococcus sp. 107-1]|uniref:hypothetical protein n=1 Tax=Planococcus sp. 107-1 TaxID=2908840 RepID=UPI001F35F7E2|nr:hypothetical protein [Planococcus sp. 107-1]UJF27452.1 hypothetical protein L0M13_02865 [Planococcus sp. 107-1]
MTDSATLKRCHEKILKTLAELNAMESRFSAYCEFYKVSTGAGWERAKLREVYEETLQPIKDIYILYALLEEGERKQMPAIDKENLKERKHQIERLYGRTAAVRKKT